MVYCVGYITDPHIPFHCPRGLSAAMNCLADSNLRGLYLGGDILDMYWANNHGPLDPRISSTLELEVEGGNKFLDMIDVTWPGIQKRFIEGNHEDRFTRYLIRQAPALFGMTSVEALLRIHDRPRWTFHPYSTSQLVKMGHTSLHVKHAPKGSSGAAIMNQNSCDLLFGHIHRIIYEKKTTGDGRVLTVASPGWLGNKESRAFSYVPGHHNWQQGFARIWIDSDTHDFRIEIIEVKNGVCYANGRKYVG